MFFGLFFSDHFLKNLNLGTSYNLKNFIELKEGGRERSVVPLIYAFIGCLLYVPCPGVKLATLAYWGNTPAN